MNRRWMGCDNDQSTIRESQKRRKNQAEANPNSYAFGDSDALNGFPVVRSSTYPTFFISYARVDSEKYIDQLCDRLREDYLYFWRDKDSIPGGTEWNKERSEEHTSE